MGRHSATDVAGTDPLVTAALAQRPAEGPRTHHAAGTSSPEGGSVGWPSDPGDPEPGGGGLGWPGRGDEQDRAASDAPVPVKARRGWRRLFGAAPAA